MKKDLHTLAFYLTLSGAVLSFGCQSRLPARNPEIDDTVTHIGVISALTEGQYEGFFAVTNLVRYGDHGLGTFDGLDGELIMIDGRVYRADEDCSTADAPISNTTPYAVVTWFSPDRMFDVEDMDEELFRRALDMRRRMRGVPQAIQIHGFFKHVTIRSVPKQKQPWRPLDEVVKTDAKKKTLSKVTGTLVGYYYPETLRSLHPSGYHLHFIDENRAIGGHVLDFEIGTARIQLDHSPYLRVTLPAKVSSPAISRQINPRDYL